MPQIHRRSGPRAGGNSSRQFPASDENVSRNRRGGLLTHNAIRPSWTSVGWCRATRGPRWAAEIGARGTTRPGEALRAIVVTAVVLDEDGAWLRLCTVVVAAVTLHAADARQRLRAVVVATPLTGTIGHRHALHQVAPQSGDLMVCCEDQHDQQQQDAARGSHGWLFPAVPAWAAVAARG